MVVHHLDESGVFQSPINMELDESHPSFDVITCFYEINDECVKKGYIQKINKDGTFVLKNGSIENIKDWEYVTIYHNAFINYNGLLKNRKKNGFGKEYYTSQKGKQLTKGFAYYIGEFLDDKRQGKGKYVNPEVNIIGEWKNDELDGYAEVIQSNEYSYKGFWKCGERCGKGKINLDDGDIYDGNFDNNMFNGFGNYYYSTGDFYSGDWKDDRKEGTGTFIYSDGRRYKGSFKNDLKDGYGEYYWPDGDIYKGFWKNGKRHGKGTKIKGDEKKEVFYRFNKKISEIIV